MRQLRKELARQIRMATFVIFSEMSLAKMAAYLPINENTFLVINGIGQKKLEIYGKLFLQVINGYKSL